MAQFVLQIGKVANRNKLFLICIYLCILNGCTNISTTQSKNAVSTHCNEKLHSIDIVDTLLSANYSILGYKHKDLVKSIGFTKRTPNIVYGGDYDSIFYAVKFQSDSIKFSHILEVEDIYTKDRNIILNNRNYRVVRIIVKDAIGNDFTDFMCDYRNAEFFENSNYILVKSVPSQWMSSAIFRFYQIIDKTNYVFYEIFMDESKYRWE